MGITAPIVVVTDLDGTLLDHDTYEAGPAAAKVAELQRADIPVVCCSAKTRAEQRVHRRELNITAPFIIENGAAVHDDDGPLQAFGLEYDTVRARLRDAASHLGVRLRGFGDMDVGEVAERTNLSAAAAGLAQQRAHTEPFVVEDSGIDEQTLRSALREVDLTLQRGARFWTASGSHDKGVAVRALRELYAARSGERPLIYGLGDTYNDAAMLAAVDIAMLVQRPDGTWADLAVDAITRLDGVGPAGWCHGADLVLAAAS